MPSPTKLWFSYRQCPNGVRRRREIVRALFCGAEHPHLKRVTHGVNLRAIARTARNMLPFGTHGAKRTSEWRRIYYVNFSRHGDLGGVSGSLDGPYVSAGASRIGCPTVRSWL